MLTTFLLYVTEVLVPTLQQQDIVVIDNLGSHRSLAVRKAIRKAGANMFFQPKYSPDLNPIEMFFSEFKHHLRKAQARSFGALTAAISPILNMITPEECRKYLNKAGSGQM